MVYSQLLTVTSRPGAAHDIILLVLLVLLVLLRLLTSGFHRGFTMKARPAFNLKLAIVLCFRFRVIKGDWVFRRALGEEASYRTLAPVLGGG
jgi:hypothetical protein